MSRITSRPVRVIAAPVQASNASSAAARVRRARHADFAALVRRDGKPSSDGDLLTVAPDDEHEHERHEEDSLAQRIGSASQRIVAAVLRREQQMLELAHVLARHVGDFASNPAIHQAGHWEVTLRIDPQRLPGTQLHLTLSPAVLLLRFDVETADTRQLLLQHAGLLERELRQLLAMQGEARTLELTVY
ncbi:type III secretion protein [Paraburkholderia sp. Tr-20389]|uniref:type III secretion system protein SctP n=1 Tax=Paraburkholderia sp. Tr-20389 TaxID=2703903 RepID=UPI001F11E177|nr:type III secretion system protein SctP [Paraburkholderia sp. Tr-20389]MBN3751832.1 type III secretion protein [Paraburkholderia sp. Tr-20389]